MRIALVVLGERSDLSELSWDAGPWAVCAPDAPDAPDAESIGRAVERCLGDADRPDLLAVWDARLGLPDAARLLEVAAMPGDVWHAGLRLGQGARPTILDTVHPSWMLLLDPPPHLVATSWRLSLRACLLRASVWRQLGGPDAGYRSLDDAALELGHRWLWGGALMRHVPALLPHTSPPELRDATSTLDEARFLYQRTGRFWACWALGRGLLTRRLPPTALASWWRLRRTARSGGRQLERSPERQVDPISAPVSVQQSVQEAAVTVLIPTLDRYPYLRVVLQQLARQTVAPRQVIVIDQTAAKRRQPAVWEEIRQTTSLPLLVLELDAPGQSSARNAGLAKASGEVVLFLDDDVEIEPDLIARHLAALERSRCDASCGVTEEAGAGPLPPEFQQTRISDVFPTCNAALRRTALERSGLFDLAFDHGARADADLGTRLYLSGALMVLEPSLSVVHHKAPAGGLRQHRARVATYASSRRSLVRHLPSVTEIYLALRYSTPQAVREVLWQRAFGTLRARGTRAFRLKKLLWGLLTLPDTLLRIASRARRARAMLADYPRIPQLETTGAGAQSEDS